MYVCSFGFNFNFLLTHTDWAILSFKKSTCPPSLEVIGKLGGCEQAFPHGSTGAAFRVPPTLQTSVRTEDTLLTHDPSLGSLKVLEVLTPVFQTKKQSSVDSQHITWLCFIAFNVALIEV